MEDLLKEDDFLLQKEFVPWARFCLFYTVTFTIFPVFAMLNKDTINNDDAPSEIHMILFLFLIPFVMSIIMVFHKKSNLYLPFKIISLAVFGLMGVYSLSTFLSAFIIRGTVIFFDDEFIRTIAGVLVLFLGVGVLSLIFIYPVMTIVQRRRIKKNI